MAKRATAKPWAAKKPAGKRDLRRIMPPPVPTVTPTPPEKPKTVEQACEQIAVLCNQIDKDIVGPLKPGTYRDPIDGHKSAIRDLTDQLDGLLNEPEPKVLPRDNEMTSEEKEAAREAYTAARAAWEERYQDPHDYLRIAMAVEPGTVPSLSRPGTFLMWFGPLPVRCTWFGAFHTFMRLEPAEPEQLWFYNSAKMEPSVRLFKDMDEVRLIFAAMMQAAVRPRVDHRSGGRKLSKPSLRGLRDTEAMGADHYLRNNLWLQRALAKGPVDVVPMPPEVLMAQPLLMV